MAGRGKKKKEEVVGGGGGGGSNTRSAVDKRRRGHFSNITVCVCRCHLVFPLFHLLRGAKYSFP